MSQLLLPQTFLRKHLHDSWRPHFHNVFPTHCEKNLKLQHTLECVCCFFGVFFFTFNLMFSRIYYWQDEKGKKTKCTAPQYVDLVMSLCQKLVTDEEVFPTKYGKYPFPFLSNIMQPTGGAVGNYPIVLTWSQKRSVGQQQIWIHDGFECPETYLFDTDSNKCLCCLFVF